ncbi:MAG TPA: GGDEF domain-containing protein [Actinoplanes sp.]|nr:GGDEF domain-containing protein [Actinoplanes sp.]
MGALTVSSGRRLASWAVYLAVAPIVVVLYYLAPRTGDASPVLQLSLYSGLTLSSAVALVAGVRRHKPSRAVAWWLLIASQFALTSADVAFFVVDMLVEDVTYPNFTDVLYLVAYPLTAVGLFLMVRARTPGWDLPSVIDAAIIAISVGLLAWIFVISPAATASDEPMAARAVATAYPTMDLLLLAVAVRLMLGAGVRSTAFRLLIASMALVLAADAVYAVQSAMGTYESGNFLDAVWMAGAALLGAAALHPSMRRLTERSAAAASNATIGRLAVLAVASVMAPATLLVQHGRGAPMHVSVTAGTCIALFLLVLARMAGIVSTQRHAAITDGLTGLRTRRFYEEGLRSEADRAARSGAPLGVLLLDIDHFKHINDTYGHHGGDRVLCEVGRRLLELSGRGNLVARYGGEEFAILLPNTTPDDLAVLGERIRRGIAMTPMAVTGTTLVTVTVSVGCAAMPAHCDTAEDLVLIADSALYAAKAGGRDRVVSARARALEPQPASA